MKGATDGSHFFITLVKNWRKPGDLCRIKLQNYFLFGTYPDHQEA